MYNIDRYINMIASSEIEFIDKYKPNVYVEEVDDNILVKKDTLVLACFNLFAEDYAYSEAKTLTRLINNYLESIPTPRG